MLTIEIVTLPVTYITMLKKGAPLKGICKKVKLACVMLRKERKM